MTAYARKTRFPETQWSLVGRAGVEDEAVRDGAVAELLEIYRSALRAFLVETRRIPGELSDDLLQDFIADRILSRRILEQANSDRGRFRNFLVKSLSNYASTKLRKEYSRQAREFDFDEALVEVPDSGQDTDRFDQEWVRSLVADTLTLMEADCRERGRMDLWEILRIRAVAPILDGAEPVSYDEIIERFELESPRQAINLLATAKRAFVRHLRVAVGRYAGGEERIEQELADLRAIVGR